MNAQASVGSQPDSARCARSPEITITDSLQRTDAFRIYRKSNNVYKRPNSSSQRQIAGMPADLNHRMPRLSAMKTIAIALFVSTTTLGLAGGQIWTADLSRLAMIFGC